MLESHEDAYYLTQGSKEDIVSSSVRGSGAGLPALKDKTSSTDELNIPVTKVDIPKASITPSNFSKTITAIKDQTGTAKRQS